LASWREQIPVLIVTGHRKILTYSSAGRTKEQRSGRR
jgi:hypothetical protein